MCLFGKPVKPLSGEEERKLMKLLDYQNTQFPTQAFNVSLFDCVEEVDTKVLVIKTQIILKLPIRGHVTTTIDAPSGQTCIYYKDVIDPNFFVTKLLAEKLILEISARLP
jgi:hypothetical protein